MRWFVFSLFISFSLPLSGENTAKLEQILDAVGSESVERDRVVGLSIGVSLNGKILCEKGYGLANVELDVPASDNTVYRIGSISKQFCAAAIMKLQEHGKLEVTDGLHKYLPDYPEHAKEVTLQHLLGHTSGIVSFTSLPTHRATVAHPVFQKDVLARFQDLPLEFSPGSKYKYCNSGYFLLGVVVEKASSRDYDKFVEENLWKPAGLIQTAQDRHALIIPHRASGHSRWGGLLKNAQYINMRQTVGAGDLVSTVGDLLRWQHALSSGKILSESSYARMTTRGTLNDGKETRYGYGFVLSTFRGDKVIEHDGAIDGFRSHLAYYPKSGYGIAVLANSDNAKTHQIADRIMEKLLQAGKSSTGTLEEN